MLSSSANQGLVAVVLRFISRAIRTFHSADLAAAPISWRDLRALRNKAANSLSHFASRSSLIAPPKAPASSDAGDSCGRSNEMSGERRTRLNAQVCHYFLTSMKKARKIRATRAT